MSRLATSLPKQRPKPAMAAVALDEANDGRELILDTAARLFRQDGYAATSLRGIAAACGMRAGSLYYHFASKDEIVGEVLRIGVERVSAEVQRAVAALPADADARTLLHTAVRAHLSALLELHDYTSANVRIFGQVPAPIRESQIATRDAYERFWTGLLKRCARSGGWTPRRDLRLVRMFVLSALNGSLEWFVDGRATVRQLANELTELVLDGLESRAGRPAPRTLRR